MYGHKDKHPITPTPRPHCYHTSGALYTVSNSLAFRPSFLLKDDRGGPTSLDMNVFALLNDRFWVGASFRTAVVLYNKDYLEYEPRKTSAVIGMAELFINDPIRIGYAYDYSLTQLRKYNYVQHDTSINYYIAKKTQEP